MKRTQIKSSASNRHDIPRKTEVVNHRGNIVEYTNTPQFEGPKVCIKGGNNRKFWSANPKEGCKIQMRIASKLLYEQIKADPSKFAQYNFTPEEIENLRLGKSDISKQRTWHHLHCRRGFLSGEVKDCDMQLVEPSKHSVRAGGLSHKGGSLSSNEDEIEQRIKKEGNWEESKFKRAMNTLEFEAYKHPKATSAGAGGILGGLLCGVYKVGGKLFGYKPTKTGYAIAFGVGATIGSVATYNKLNDGKIYK